ncbi:nucleotidyltransferase family protein [Gemmatimonadota bacterium]
MEAMILAAGEGTRLRPLTERVPKALVEVGGRSLLGRVIERLVQAGAGRIIVNTHHHEEQIRAYLRDHAPGGVEIALSPEPGGPYDTGGGLFAAAHLFREKGPFLLHNVDVLSTISLEELFSEHERARAVVGEGLVASLAVNARDARRGLLFDERGLMGWDNRGNHRDLEETHRVREPVGSLRRWAFTGIHVVEPRIFDLVQRSGTFSVITLYLELAAEGHIISPVDVSDYDWIDVGTPERLEKAKEAFGGR